MTRRSLIVLEANEIPFKIFDYYCRLEPDSQLAKVFGRSRQFRTHTEDKTRFIMPWTTWPSFHRGVNDELHQIFKFGQWEIETDAMYPPLWAILARHGVRSGVFSSMQCAPLPANRKDYAFYFPDMFANDSAVEPPELEPLQEFNLEMTRESARNVSRRIDLASGLKVVFNSGKLGIQVRTYLDIGRHLVAEAVDPALKVRRRAYQPVLLFDAFYRQLVSKRPQFSTFFTNHVAAAMHRYWAATFPEDYEDFRLEREWVEKYKGEIAFAMRKLDGIVGRLVGFVDANPDFLLVIATSMGQAAIPASHVKEFLTLTDVDKFMHFMGLEQLEYEERPAMVPDFSFKVQRSRADEFESVLRRLTIGDAKVDYHRDDDFFHLSLYNERPEIRTVGFAGEQLPIEQLGIGYMIHEDEVACTAQHVPQGSLVIYDPQIARAPRGDRKDISALDFAPAVLTHFGIPVPSYMRRGVDVFAYER